MSVPRAATKPVVGAMKPTVTVPPAPSLASAEASALGSDGAGATVAGAEAADAGAGADGEPVPHAASVSAAIAARMPARRRVPPGLLWTSMSVLLLTRDPAVARRPPFAADGCRAGAG